MSKKTICALVAGFITAFSLTGLFSISTKEARANAPDSRIYSDLDSSNTGGWYSNMGQRGEARRKRIFKYMS